MTDICFIILSLYKYRHFLAELFESKLETVLVMPTCFRVVWFSMNKDILLHNHCAGLKIRTVYHRSNSVAIAQRQILSIFPMILFITSFFSFFLLTQASNQGHELHSASCLLNLLQAGPLDPGFLEYVPGWSSCEVRLSLRSSSVFLLIVLHLSVLVLLVPSSVCLQFPLLPQFWSTSPLSHSLSKILKRVPVPLRTGPRLTYSRKLGSDS